MVLFLGARIKGCPPPDCSACTSGRTSATPKNMTTGALPQLSIPYAHHQTDLTKASGLQHAGDPALSKFGDPAWLSSATTRLRGAWGLDSLVFLRTAGGSRSIPL